jgi:hypothetical protein
VFANDIGFETRPVVVVVAAAVVVDVVERPTRLLVMSKSFFRHSHSHSAATGALTAFLHRRHGIRSPKSSNSSIVGNFTAVALQNGTAFGNLTVTDMTMGVAGRGLLNGSTANSAATTSPRVSHEDYGSQINFTIWLLTALSAMFLALRVYCKFLRHRGLWWDDHILIASWVRNPVL